MARAQGANALLNLAFESTYGIVPGSGFKKVPFVSASLGEQQNLIDSDLLGYGRDSGFPVHELRLHRCAEGQRHPHFDGRQGPLDG